MAMVFRIIPASGSPCNPAGPAAACNARAFVFTKFCSYPVMAADTAKISFYLTGMVNAGTWGSVCPACRSNNWRNNVNVDLDSRSVSSM